MAESKGLDFGFLKQKLGPLPLGVWAAAALAIYLYLQHRNKTGAGGQQTDPAGNVGQINPNTGYVIGSPEDKAAQAGSSAPTSDTGSSGSTVAGKYEDNNAWGRAAVNLLVSIGVDPTQANEAVQQYLSSQTLTTQQQADVNMAIQALGPPPSLPGPTGTAPGPVANPPGSSGGGGQKPPPKTTTYAANPPHGLVVTRRTRTSISLKWNKVAHATGYTIRYGEKRPDEQHSATTPASKTSITIGNLEPNSAYYFSVTADPAKRGAPHAGPVLGHTAK